MKNLLKKIWQASSLFAIYIAIVNIDDAAGGTIYNPESLKHLDKADEFIKLKNSKTTKP